MSTPIIVFYRNMNLGHRNSPDRAMLEDTLREAGASSARSFQTNGTVLIEADAEPHEVVLRAAPRLLSLCGYNDAAFVRPLGQLTAILDRDPFAGTGDEQTYRETFTFFDDAQEFGAPIPWTNGRGDVEIIEFADGVALGLIRRAGTRVGNPTAELESRLKVPASTRTSGTIRRLVKAFG
ncbi:DUF1697 domain-containing protein [Sinosporangium siamense]|uniref:DUF1697 domain-containing protein n=1 Tax=Sinosporangium siamense TaxID=1367973 RepID=A0A919RJU1_9ACTN|nr:DUF1697 domain-containing protein [Sinosporangium siamense]GII94145.1 hypothetical protein Ssi02_43760 [Sinosporangium siamense]